MQRSVAADVDGGKKCWETDEGCKNVVGYAQELQLDVAKFKTDMKDECQKLVQSDMVKWGKVIKDAKIPKAE